MKSLRSRYKTLCFSEFMRSFMKKFIQRILVFLFEISYCILFGGIILFIILIGILIATGIID